MAIEVVTMEDLQNFKSQLLQDIQRMLNKPAPSQKEWLKAAEVRKLLGISDGKLQHLRITGLLPSSKIGGVHYYSHRDILNMMEINSIK
jgi:hypothetical protein